jgi:hypothetical protein
MKQDFMQQGTMKCNKADMHATTMALYFYEGSRTCLHETATERRMTEGRKTERRMTKRRMTKGRMIEGRK